MFYRIPATIGVLFLGFCWQLAFAGTLSAAPHSIGCQGESRSCHSGLSPCCPRASCTYGKSVFAKWLHGDYWPAFTSWEIKPGNRRVLGDGLLMVPLYQDRCTMLFADVRGQTDDNDAREGNWGLGLRRIVNDQYIWGVYGFYDLRYSENQNYFSQGMMGMELMSVNGEARVNGYIPDTSAKPAGGAAGTTAALIGNNIYVLGGWERAYYGLDAEVGALLHCWGDNADMELRGFAGGFHFDNNAAGFPSISGPSGRLELRSYDLNLLGCGSRLALGCEVTWDQVRDTQVFGFARIGIPIGPGSRKVGRLSRLRRRMLDRIERDVDVVTNAQGNAPELAVYADTSQPIGNVTVIDATTADVPGTVTAAGPNSTIIADGSKGQIDVSDYPVMQDGQTLRGAGFLVQGQNSGTQAVFGSRPTIHRTDDTRCVIRIADNATIRDIDFSGGIHGILGDDVTGFAILNNSFNTREGVLLNGVNNGDIIGNTCASSGGGIYVETLAGGTVSDNTTSGHIWYGIWINELQGGTVSGNTSTGDNHGFWFRTVSGGTLSDNTASGSTINGFYVHTLSGGVVSDNTSIGNTDDGFFVRYFQGTAQLNDNYAADNGGQGYRVTVTGGTPTAANNTGQNNTGGSNSYTYP